MIGFYAHHQGSGHVTRATRIARHCGEVVGFSSAPRPAEWPGRWVVLPDDDVPAPDGDPTASGVLHWAPTGPHPYGERMRLLAKHLTELDLDLLFVDVSVEVTLLARLLGLPVAVAAMRGDRSDRPHRLAYDAAEVLLAPWPPSLPEEWPPHVLAKTVHTGGISRLDSRLERSRDVSDHLADSPVSRADGEPRTVFALWGRGGGDWSTEEWADVHERTPGWVWRRGADPGDVETALATADVVLTHAGQNAVAEVAAARRPAVVVALDRPHGEQVATADALRRGGLADTVDAVHGPPDVDWSALLERAASRSGAEWAAWSDGFGAYRAARTLVAASHRRRLADRTAVVTLVRGRHDHLRRMLAGLAAGTTWPERVVVVAMGDPDAADVCREVERKTGLAIDVTFLQVGEHLPLARARNHGADLAGRRGCETLVFLDVDCIPGADLLDRYVTAVTSAPADQRPSIWSGPVTYLPPAEDYRLADLPGATNPHPARPAPAPGEVLPADDLRLFWSLSFALRGADYDALGGFDERYEGYGGEDTDFAMRLQQADGRLFWLGGADAYHQHHPTQNPPVQHLHDIVRNANIFADTWGRHPMEGWLAAFAEAGLAALDEDTGRWRVTGSAW